MPRKRNQVDEDDLKRAYVEEGCTSRELAERYGVSKPVILRLLEKLGVKRRSLRKVTPEIARVIAEMAYRGVSITDAEIITGLEATTLRLYAKASGVVFQDGYHVGYITTWNGYRKVPAGDHLGADSKGYVMEHVLVAEKALGRFLSMHEVVHHKDGDKTNNAPENLEVMTRSQHASLHAKAGDTGWLAVHKKRKI